MAVVEHDGSDRPLEASWSAGLGSGFWGVQTQKPVEKPALRPALGRTEGLRLAGKTPPRSGT